MKVFNESPDRFCSLLRSEYHTFRNRVLFRELLRRFAEHGFEIFYSFTFPWRFRKRSPREPREILGRVDKQCGMKLFFGTIDINYVIYAVRDAT